MKRARRTWRLMALPAVLMAMASFLVVFAQPANASPMSWSIQGWTKGSSGWANFYTGNVLDAYGWGTSNWTPVQMYPRRPTPSNPTEKNQRWRVDMDSSKAGPYVNVLANKCLDESAPSNGAVVYLFECHGRANQNWKLHLMGWAGVEPYYELVNSQDGRCLDVKDYNGNSGARLQVFDCTGAWNQRFRPVLGGQ